MDWLWLVWIFPCTFFTYLLFCFLRNMRLGRTFVWEEPKDFLIFQITTNGQNSETVKESVVNIEKLCSELNYTKPMYRIDIVTEEGDRNNYNSSGNNRVNTIVVPKIYETNAIRKARALQYVTEIRRTKDENKENIWVYHLDDESLVTEQCLSAISHHINNGKEPIAQGWIIYPRNFTESFILSGLAQCIRPFGCYECKWMTDIGFVIQLHGSNLLIRADVEDEVGWQYGKSIAEDSIFGIKAQEAGYKIGWHYGVLEEQPVFNLRDHAMQRNRWFRGGWQNVRQINRKFKFPLALKLIIWFVGFPAGVIAVTALFFPQTIPLVARILLLPGTLTWVASYQIGLLSNARLLSKKRRISYHILTLILTPLLGFIETAPVFFFYLLRFKGFYVVRKDLTMRKREGAQK